MTPLYLDVLTAGFLYSFHGFRVESCQTTTIYHDQVFTKHSRDASCDDGANAFVLKYSTRLSTRRLRFEMAPKKKAAKDAATDIPQVCWCYSALNDPFEDLLIDPEIGDNVFTLGKMTPYCHYVAAQHDSAITTTPPKKQRTLDPKSEAKRITSPKMYGTSPSKALRFHIL